MPLFPYREILLPRVLAKLSGKPGVEFPIPTLTAFTPVPPNIKLLLTAAIALYPIAVALVRLLALTSAAKPRAVL